ncbi:MAG: tripartite tricarboxylate transporter substrate binding protein [Rubritepida sp.]|jgi:tripartite-type tricarboxylate transporter receptor subunit TctC|nr:tripartite tricarboxylate transporter substrate binding protein [Rubritepida sp.]
MRHHQGRRAPLAAPALSALPARAQAAWPQRAVRVIVPFAAGGGTDLTARAVMEQVAQRLNQPIVVENRPGADGAIGTEVVARSAADGHTLVALNPTHLLLRHTRADLPYHPTEDLAPVVIQALYPFVLMAATNAPFRDLPGLIAAARARPGEIGQGTADVSSGVVAAQFAAAAGIALNEVRYPGGAASMRDLMGGHLPLAWVSTATALPLLGSDRVRMLAVTSPEPSPFLPEVPTLAGHGLAAANYEGWFGLWAPARTPEDVLLRINAEANAAAASEVVQARMRSLAVNGVRPDLAAVRAMIVADVARWARAEQQGLLRRA